MNSTGKDRKMKKSALENDREWSGETLDYKRVYKLKTRLSRRDRAKGLR
jgi:hypothetical protein